MHFTVSCWCIIPVMMLNAGCPSDGHQAILNKRKSQRHIESGRTMAVEIKHARSAALEWSVCRQIEAQSVFY